MKNLFILLLCISSISFTACHKTTPTEKVKSAFEKLYPDAMNTSWEQEKKGEWEAEFKQDGIEMEAAFDKDGNWLETDYEISAKELPEAVLASLKAEFVDFEIEFVESVSTPDFEGYEIEIEKEDENGDFEYEVYISKEGEIVKKEALDEDDD